MARRGLTAAQRRAAAVQGGLQMISRGDRPLYRVTANGDGQWATSFPGVTVAAGDPYEAVEAARAAIAAVLEVEPTMFDVEAERRL